MSRNQPEIIFKPKQWGWEKWIVNKPEYCGKLLYIAKGRKCSLHYHRLKTETFYVQYGSLKLFYSDGINEIKEITELLRGKENLYNKNPSDFLPHVVLCQGDNFEVPSGRLHQFLALEDTEMFEFSTQHFEEDSYRIVKGD